MRTLVLGGAGFIGRNVVRACLAEKMQVTVAGRSTQGAKRKLGSLAQHCSIVKIQFEHHLDAGTWLPLITGFDTVINCVGILRPRLNEPYEAIYVTAPTALARACRIASSAPERLNHPIRFIHVTALGLKPDARSGFNTCKYRSELSVQNVALEHAPQGKLDYSIVRPSILDGEGGFGALWLRRVANWPIHFIPSSAKGMLAPLLVSELGVAIANLSKLAQRDDLRIVDCGGPTLVSMPEYLLQLRSKVHSPTLRMPIPQWLARLVSHCFDIIHFSPLSFGHLELMTKDNKPTLNRMRELLGHEPSAVGPQ
jgi:nucleoside-diphosphate-sugar epimerase